MMKLLVRSIRLEAENIRSFELVSLDGQELPSFAAGAHIDVLLPNGMIRQYSLFNRPSVRSAYKIAVLRDTCSRGGSENIHTQVAVGDILEVSSPRNLFSLASKAEHSLLIAGGIGITPLLSMASSLEAENRSFELHYCTRTQRDTAFYEYIKESFKPSNIHFYHDNGNPKNGINFEQVLSRNQMKGHLYYCGPAGFMQAIKLAARNWPADRVHFEMFAAPEAVAEQSSMVHNDEFDVVLDRSQISVRVNRGESILEAIREAGIDCASSCESGVCGACKVSYLDGEPEHRDYILDDEERKRNVLICCAGCKTAALVLDL